MPLLCPRGWQAGAACALVAAVSARSSRSAAANAACCAPCAAAAARLGRSRGCGAASGAQPWRSSTSRATARRGAARRSGSAGRSAWWTRSSRCWTMRSRCWRPPVRRASPVSSMPSGRAHKRAMTAWLSVLLRLRAGHGGAGAGAAGGRRVEATTALSPQRLHCLRRRADAHRLRARGAQQPREQADAARRCRRRAVRPSRAQHHWALCCSDDVSLRTPPARRRTSCPRGRASAELSAW